MLRTWMVMGLCAVLATGCGSKADEEETKLAGEPLDCAWLASNNCWKTTVAAASSCVPPATETGVLSADGASCAYAGGASVAFNPPVVLPIDIDFPEWNFTQSEGGQACVTFDGGGGGSSLVLTVQGMTYREHLVGLSLQATCPDGTHYAAQDARDLLDCPNYADSAAGFETSTSGSSVQFALRTGSDPDGDMGALSVFDCAR